MSDIPEEHLTEELLDRLLASASIEQYLDEGLVSARTLTDYLFCLLYTSPSPRDCS